MPKNTIIPAMGGPGLAPPVDEQSIRFDSVRGTDLRGYFPSVTASSDRWMMSFWIKPQDINVAHTYLHAEIDANNFTTLRKDNFNRVIFEASIGGVLEANFRSSRFWPLDVSNWHHIYLQFFRTAGNLQLFVNGNIWVNYDIFNGPTNIPGYAWLNPAAEHFVGTDVAGTRFSGMMADLHSISGDTAGNPNGFGSFDGNGTWVRSAFAGPWNVDGFNLTFGRTIDLGEDFSGNGNDFPTHTNAAAAGADQFDDWMERNYTILDRNDPRTLGGITEGGLVLTAANGRVTMRPPANSGVYYYERNDVAVTFDTVGGEFDPDLTPASYNFGQLPFVDVGPSGGELTVNSLNLPVPLITNARDHFAATGYTGNSINPRTIITGSRGIPQHRDLLHRSDHVWVKNMSPSLGNGHFLMDRLRPGVQLQIDTGGAEEATNLNGFITALLDPGPGFDVDAGGTDEENVNDAVDFYSAVSWQIDAYGINMLTTVALDTAEEITIDAGAVGDTDTTSSDLEMVEEGVTPVQEVGLRYRNVLIPQGAQILEARIQFTANDTNAGADDMLMFCEDIDDAPVFVNGSNNFNITNRTKTSPGVAWSPAAWNILQERAAAQLTSSFGPELQQVVDRAGWASGNSLVWIVAEDPGGTRGEREAEANPPDITPELQVRYRSPGVGFDSNVSVFVYDGIGVPRDVMHGLGTAPDFIAVKRRDAANDWSVYFSTVVSAGTPEDGRLGFNNNNAWAAGNDWDNTAPGGTFFRVGTSGRVNTNGGEYAGMAIANLEGFSKVFRYVGNNSSNGPVVYCGFKPRLIWIKSTAAGGQWVFHTRASGASGAIQSVNNQMDGNMYINTDDQATQLDSINGYSRGFQIRDTNPNINNNLQEYVGVAFAEVPFQNAKGAL